MYIPNRRIIRIVSFLLLAAVIWTGMPVTLHAAQYGDRENVKVGFFPFDGYHMVNEDGELCGYGYDILQDMLLYENWQYEFVGYEDDISWSQAQEMLDRGEIDLLTSATMSDERLEKYDYSDIPIGTSSTILTVQAGDGRFDTSDYSSWNGLRVGMLSNNSRNDSFTEYATEHGFRYQAVEYDTPDELQEELEKGNLDMIVTSNLLALQNVQEVDRFDEKPFYVIVKKGNTKLLEEVNDALRQVQNNNYDFADELYAKYYEPQSNGVVTYTKAEQRFIDEANQEEQVFTAVVNPDRRPLAYDTDGTVKGLLVDISKTVFERTGLKIQFLVPNNRDEYLQAINEQQVDIICDFTGTNAKAAESGYVLTDAYYNSSVSRLVRRDYDGSGTRCALTKSSTTKHMVEDQEGIEYIYFDTNEECQDAIRDGRADFTYNYTRVLQEVVYSDVRNSFMCVSAKGMSVDFKMAVSLQCDAYFTSIINKCVNSINEEDISYLSEPYTYYDRTNSSLIKMVYDHPVFFITMAVLVLLIGFSLIVVYIFKKRNEKEKELNIELKTALDSVATANSAKTAFLSRVSHDMRTPLNGILGLNRILKDKVEDEEQLSDLEQMQISGEYLLNLVNDTLDVSRIENGKLELHPQVHDARAMLETVLTLVSPSIDEKQIQLTLNENDAPFGLFYIDSARFEQVFLNIMSNAVKFTPRGGNVRVDMNKISDEGSQFKVKFTIRDSGVGMSAEFLPHIFEPFSQSDESSKNAYQGTGLGMTITKEIVTLMGGEISVESEVGSGTTVVFTMVIHRASEEQIQSWKAKKDKAAHVYDLQGKCILLCEDHPLNADIVKRLIEKVGGTIAWAKDGVKGCRMFADSTEQEYAAILMDIRMPNRNGIEAAREIRAMDRADATQIPILALSANAYEEDIKECLAAGMNAHLAKPIDPEKLYEMLQELT